MGLLFKDFQFLIRIFWTKYWEVCVSSHLLLSCSFVTNFASPKGIEIMTKWLSRAVCRCHKLCNFCARLNQFLGVYRKNGDRHLLRFSVLFIVVCSVFSVNAFFMEKIAKQNRLFQLFKKVNTGHFVSRFSPWKMHQQK